MPILDFGRISICWQDKQSDCVSVCLCTDKCISPCPKQVQPFCFAHSTVMRLSRNIAANCKVLSATKRSLPIGVKMWAIWRERLDGTVASERTRHVKEHDVGPYVLTGKHPLGIVKGIR